MITISQLEKKIAYERRVIDSIERRKKQHKKLEPHLQALLRSFHLKDIRAAYKRKARVNRLITRLLWTRRLVIDIVG